MAILDTYYRIIEKKTILVSRKWKDIHLLLFAIGTVSGFCSTYLFSYIIKTLGNNCPLYASFIYDNNTNITNLFKRKGNNSKELADANIVWPIDDDTWCDYCKITLVLSIVYCSFWISLFMMCSKGGGGYPNAILTQPWKLVYPLMIFSIVFAIILLVTFLKLKKGFDYFCNQLSAPLKCRCSPTIDIFTLLFGDEKVPIYQYMQICIYSAFVCCISWFAQTILLISRVLCIVDFTIIRILLSELPENSSRQQESTNAEIKPLTSSTSLERTSLFQDAQHTTDTNKDAQQLKHILKIANVENVEKEQSSESQV